MEFWIGLSVGMHLGKFIADHLEKYLATHKLLEPSTLEKIDIVDDVASELGSIAEEQARGE